MDSALSLSSAHRSGYIGYIGYSSLSSAHRSGARLLPTDRYIPLHTVTRERLLASYPLLAAELEEHAAGL